MTFVAIVVFVVYATRKLFSVFRLPFAFSSCVLEDRNQILAAPTHQHFFRSVENFLLFLFKRFLRFFVMYFVSVRVLWVLVNFYGFYVTTTSSLLCCNANGQLSLKLTIDFERYKYTYVYVREHISWHRFAKTWRLANRTTNWHKANRHGI